MSYLERIRTSGNHANPFFCLMGIEIVSSEPGKALLKMQIRPDMHNGVGWLQGGILGAIADEAMALALYPLLFPEEGIATISESTTFIKGVRDGVIIAEGRVIKKGRRVAFTEGEVWTENGSRTILSRTSAAFAVTTNKSQQ
jgi:acyl-CoA thioesterase